MAEPGALFDMSTLANRILGFKFRLSISSVYLMVAFIVITTLWVASLSLRVTLVFEGSAKVRTVYIDDGALGLDSFSTDHHAPYPPPARAVDVMFHFNETWYYDIRDNFIPDVVYRRTKRSLTIEIPILMVSFSLGLALVFPILSRSWKFRNAP